jgi:glutamate synthase (NADPH) large chain
MLMLESPVLSNAQFEAMRGYMGEHVATVDCTWPVAEGEAGLRRAIERIRREAEEGVRSGCAHVILTDEAQSPSARRSR